MSLEGKNAVIFGGGGDIGLAIGQKLLKEGVQKLYILDVAELSEENLSLLRNSNSGAQVMFEICDITDRMNLQQILEQHVVTALGTIDIFVNAAGTVETDPAELININLTGTINTSLIGLNLMSRAKGGNGGTIVNIASTAGLEPVPFFPVYCASKHGIVGFTRSLGIPTVYDETGVKLLTICPGGTRTKMFNKCRNLSTDIKALQKMFQEYKYPCEPQSPDVVGTCVAQAIVEGENGSTWICHSGKIYQHSFPASQFL